MIWSWEIGLLVAISVLALVLALIAWRRRYIADLLEASLNATHQGRQVVDRAGTVKFDNGAFRRLFGDEKQPLNVILERRAFDAAARAAIERIEHALAERGEAHGDVAILNADGKREILAVFANRLTRFGDHVSWGVEVITTQREIEEYIRSDHEKFADLIENAPVGFYSVDESGRFLFPGTGRASDIGGDGAPGSAANVPLFPGTTGDVWLGMFGGGLARFSGGRFDHWHQLNSGLVNDVVYGLAIEGDNVWCATTAGASRYNTVTKEWTIFTEKNAPMEEIWNYGVSYNGSDKVFLAVWGSGVLEYDVKTNRWKDYLDPDGEMEIDLFKDDGLVHDVIPSVSYENGVLWAASYFGLSRYDGRHWRTYFADNSGLASDFINFVKARGNVAWVCTDNGLSSFDGTTWVTYRRVGSDGGATEEQQQRESDWAHPPSLIDAPLECKPPV